MEAQEAISIVKDIARRHGVRKTAAIFGISSGAVSHLTRGDARISGKRLVKKVSEFMLKDCPKWSPLCTTCGRAKDLEKCQVK